MTTLAKSGFRTKGRTVNTTQSEEKLHPENPNSNNRKHVPDNNKEHSEPESRTQDEWENIASMLDKILLAIFTITEVILVLVLCIQNVK